jgi:hypothetical protein
MNNQKETKNQSDSTFINLIGLHPPAIGTIQKAPLAPSYSSQKDHGI